MYQFKVTCFLNILDLAGSIFSKGLHCYFRIFSTFVIIILYLKSYTISFTYCLFYCMLCWFRTYGTLGCVMMRIVKSKYKRNAYFQIILKYSLYFAVLCPALYFVSQATSSIFTILESYTSSKVIVDYFLF